MAETVIVLAGDPTGENTDTLAAGWYGDPEGGWPDGVGSQESRTMEKLRNARAAFVEKWTQVDPELKDEVQEAKRAALRENFVGVARAEAENIAKKDQRLEGDFFTALLKHKPKADDPAAAVRLQEIRGRFFAPDADRLGLIAAGDPETLIAVLTAPGVYQNPLKPAEQRALEESYLRATAGAEFDLWEKRKAATALVAQAIRATENHFKGKVRSSDDRAIDEIAAGR